MGRNWRNICFLILYYCGVKKAIPYNDSEIWIQMYMLMYIQMDCQWFKHGDYLIKFVKFLAMYTYVFWQCRECRYVCFGEGSTVEIVRIQRELSWLRRNAQWLNSVFHFKYVDMSQIHWGILTQLMHGANWIWDWHRQTKSSSSCLYTVCDIKAHRCILEPKRNHCKP